MRIDNMSNNVGWKAQPGCDLRIKKSYRAALFLPFALIAVAANAQPITFAPPLQLPATRPNSVAAADLNGDLRLDIIATDASGPVGSLVVYLNTGGRTFPPGVSYPSFFEPAKINIADFNHDGRLDAAVLSSLHFVSVHLGDGLGGFGPPINTVLPDAVSPPQALAAGNFNADANPDLIVGGQTATGQGLILLPGDGTGGFSAPVPIPSGNYPVSVVARDFNADGKLDFAAANFTDPQGVSVHLGDGAGNFAPPVFYPVASLADGITAGLIDGNSSVDLVVSTANTISTLLNDGNGTFGPAIATPFPPGFSPRIPALADFNFDGRTDAVVPRYDNINVLAGTGTGTFVLQSSIPATAAGFPAISADFDGDGKPDVAMPAQDAIVVLFNNSPATIATAPLAGTPALIVLMTLLVSVALVKLRG